MRTLTLQTLIDEDACSQQVDLFRAKFGESVEVTEALCRSVASEFDWDWAAHNLLSKNGDADYLAKLKPLEDDYLAKRKPMDDDYEAKIKPLYDDYMAKIKPLEDDYWAKCRPLVDDYLAKVEPLEDDYRAKRKPLEDDYRAKCAVLFARCYVGDQP
jgi:hypothetical protein